MFSLKVDCRAWERPVQILSTFEANTNHTELLFRFSEITYNPVYSFLHIVNH